MIASRGVVHEWKADASITPPQLSKCCTLLSINFRLIEYFVFSLPILQIFISAIAEPYNFEFRLPSLCLSAFFRN